MVKKNIFLFIITLLISFILSGCNINNKPSQSNIEVSFLNEEVTINFNETNSYSLEYTVTNGCDVSITCDRNDGFELVDKTITFTKTGIYKFTITATKNDKVVTDTIVINVVEEVMPMIVGYKKKDEYDMSLGLYLPELTVEPSEGYDLTYASNKSIDVVDGKIQFNEVGTHVITVTVSIGRYSDSVTMEVRVFDMIDLTGAGTVTSPYEVYTIEDLLVINEAIYERDIDFKDKYFLQMNDIDLSSEINWLPIGTNGLPFAGTYDGGNYKIENLEINTTESFQGFFGYVTGVIKNVNVYGSLVVEQPNLPYSHSYVGGIAGAINNGGKIINCTNYADIQGDSNVGGIVGEIMKTDYLLFGLTYSQVINCTNYGKILCNAMNAKNEDASYYGGITGYNCGQIIGCKNYGEVDGETLTVNAIKKNSYVGGIAGYCYIPFKSGAGPNEILTDFITIENSINYGYIHGSYGIGGIAGQQAYIVKNCINEGTIKGNNCTGGIAGISGTSGTVTWGINQIVSCENKGLILSSSHNEGGIAGYSYGVINNCVNTGNISPVEGKSTYNIGGIAGLNATGEITSCTNSGAIVGNHSAGGIVGRVEGEGYKISECLNEVAGTITATGYMGGIAGRTEKSSKDMPIVIEKCTNKATITGVEGYIGGIIGMHGSYNKVQDCKNYGDVSGKGYKADSSRCGVGGISGEIHSSSVVDGCENYGNVTGERVTGGIVGKGDGGSASLKFTINNCINKGTVKCNYASGDAWVGGVLGYGAQGNLTNCTNEGTIINTNGAKYVYTVYGKLASTVSESNNSLNTKVEKK